MNSWLEALDGMELRLAHSEALLRGEPAPIEPPVDISDLGPIPADLIERARHILARTDATARMMQAEMNRISFRISESEADRPAPAFVDARA